MVLSEVAPTLPRCSLLDIRFYNFSTEDKLEVSLLYVCLLHFLTRLGVPEASLGLPGPQCSLHESEERC